jgi:hypothetical protein
MIFKPAIICGLFYLNQIDNLVQLS